MEFLRTRPIRMSENVPINKLHLIYTNNYTYKLCIWRDLNGFENRKISKLEGFMEPLTKDSSIDYEGTSTIVQTLSNSKEAPNVRMLATAASEIKNIFIRCYHHNL